MEEAAGRGCFTSRIFVPAVAYGKSVDIYILKSITSSGKQGVEAIEYIIRFKLLKWLG